LVLLNPDLTVLRGSRNAEELLGLQLTPGLAARTLYRRLRVSGLSSGPWPAEDDQVTTAAVLTDGSHGRPTA